LLEALISPYKKTTFDLNQLLDQNGDCQQNPLRKSALRSNAGIWTRPVRYSAFNQWFNVCK